jgi:hypothetical protein
MTWPAVDVVRTNADSGTDVPATFRTDVLDLIDKFNQVRAHPTTFSQGVLSGVDAAAWRTSLSLGTLATQSGTFSGTSSGTNTGDQTTISGNAGTATALQTARAIGNTSFNGTADIVPGYITGLHAADIASAATLNLGAAVGDVVDVTGTTTVTAITLSDGVFKVVRFTGILTLTNGASLVLPGAANIVTAAGDYAVFRGYAAGVVRCTEYMRAALVPGTATTVTGAAQTAITSVGTLTSLTTSGAITITAAASKIVPGATSLSLRNTADSADNLIVTDAGAFTSRLGHTMGTGTGVATLVAVAYVNTTAVGNVGAGAQDLMVTTLQANSLSSNGKGIELEAWGTTANNANAKTIAPKWGSIATGFSFTISQAGFWYIKMIILRAASSSQDRLVIVKETTQNATLQTPKEVLYEDTLSEVDTAGISVGIRVSATSNNDVVQEGLKIKFLN